MRPLTKSLFVQGMNCPALLWHLVNEREQLPEPTEMDKAVMEQGVQVGLLAQDRYPGGIGVRGQAPTAALLTKRLLSRGVPLYEATFEHGRLLCKNDVLIPDGEGYKLVEVKSSGRVKDDHLLDVAFQTHVLQQAGITVTSSHVMHINTSYVRQGDLDLDELFTEEDVTERITPLLETIADDIKRLLAVMDGPKPGLEGHPHGCALDHLVELPEHNVTELYRTNGHEHLQNGVTCITDCDPQDLNKKQQIQHACITTGQAHIDKDKLRAWLDNLNNPIVHLDFETINPAIPPWDGTSPYEQLPFQFSAHIEDGADITHAEFLGDGKNDPRIHLCDALCKLPTSGCYLAHNASFEKRVLRALAKHSPEHAETLRKIEQTMHDTIVPFRNFWYHSPEQHGSCSIKAVLPALTEKSYDDLTINNGAVAQVMYAKLASCSAEEAARIREDLLAYCKLDTEGMVEILKALRNACA